MSGAELALGIVGAVDVCYRYGKDLVKTCRAVRNADSHLSEASLRVEACWVRICSQLSLLRSIETSLDEHHREVHLQVLDILLNMLQAVDSRLVRLSKRGSPGADKAKFALMKGGLAEAIKELDDWQGVFEPTWFLIMRMAIPEIDNQIEVAARSVVQPAEADSLSAISAARHMRRALKPEYENSDSVSRSSMIFSPDGLVSGSFENVHYSPVRTAARIGTGQLVLLDPIVCRPHSAINAVLKDSRRLAGRLRHTDPSSFGLLECKGLIKEPMKDPVDVVERTQLSFVFRLPHNLDRVQSVRGKLLGGVEYEYDSLTKRVDLARQLVRAVSSVHNYDFVHKNIRPDTILLLSTLAEQNGAIDTAVLVGFEAFRSADGNTYRLGDDDWEKNIYRHPSRQGRIAEVDYDMRHDIYSIGVCLLEIGLWESFVCYSQEDSPLEPCLGPGLVDAEMDLMQDTKHVKDYLLELARGKLKRNVGTRYSEVVETCLTCLDEENVDFGDERDFEDEDGITVGARYIEKVVVKLSHIVV